MSILKEIIANKSCELEAARKQCSPAQLAGQVATLVTPPRDFRGALREASMPGIIAEIKHRSPSRGEIRANFDASDCARAYASGGAVALSVLTDQTYFGGSLDDLEKVRAAVSLPLLRKDFVIDAYQIDQARLAGADAVLLIVAALEDEQLHELHQHAQGLGLTVLVEVHDEAELERALSIGANTVGVNNRDLRNFEVHLETTERLAPLLPDGVLLVAESGIHTYADCQRLAKAGAQAFLVGESLMRQTDLVGALHRLRGME